jgi:Dolichyl-phosphate-mannose-protein mannosyltransferase
MSSFAPSETIRPISRVSPGSSPFLTVRLIRFAALFADNHGWLLFAAICLSCGWGAMNAMVVRHLNHDELFTFYIAQAPSLGELLKISHTVDLQPPLAYLLVRLSFAIFGVSSWACRLPFLVAYFVSSAIVFYFLRRLLSPTYGLIGTLLLWSNPLAYLAREARPYSILLCFTTLMLVSWYLAVAVEGWAGRSKALALVMASGFGLLLSHVFGLLVYAAFFVAEVLRFAIRRKADWTLWAMLLVPLCSVVTYLPLLHNHSTILFAKEYHVTPILLLSFYWESIRFLITPLAFIALLAALWPLWRTEVQVTMPVISRATYISFGFLLTVISLMPLAIGILLGRMGTAFFNRYGVVWLVPLAIVPALILGYCTGRNRIAGLAAVLMLTVMLVFNTAGKAWLVDQVSNLVPPGAAAKALYVVCPPPIIPVHYPPTPRYLEAELATAPFISHLDSVAPELPMVANTGLTFVEVDHQETAQVAQRLYMLTDEEAASTIAHDTVFAHYEEVKQAFPVIRGKVEPYQAFIAAHPRFVVLGAYNNPQGWLLRKLDRDGANLRVIGTCTGYSEDCQIYEVSVRPDNLEP